MPWPESILRTEKLFSGQGFYQNIFWENPYFYYIISEHKRNVSLLALFAFPDIWSYRLHFNICDQTLKKDNDDY